MVLLTILIGLCAVALALPTCSDLLSLAFLLRRRSSPGPVARVPTPRLLLLIPAHNEELLIETCLDSLHDLKYPRDCLRVVVIADNCVDRTAQLARRAGVDCLERHEPALPGKPHAVAWALERLSYQSEDAVVILDADTIVDRGFAAALATAAPLRHKAVQGYNGVSNPDDNAMTRMAAVFADAKCSFAYALKQRAGLNIPLRLGGCIGTALLATHGWEAFSIGEDWELYALLTARGVRIEGVPSARVYAQEARELRQSAPQRKRWAAGRLTVLARTVVPLLSSGRIGLRQKLDALAELSAPGPVVHLGLAAVLAGLTLALQPPATPVLVSFLLVGVARHAVYTAAALTQQPQPGRAALAFAFLPFYGLWRCGVELAALRMLGDKPWVRTERHRHA